MPGLFTPSIVFTFITHYWFFHHNTLNSDALLDPCFKTGYLTCKTYKSMRTLVVETLDRTRNQGTISCPPARTPEKSPSAPFEIRTFPGRADAVTTRLYQNQAWFHHSLPFSSSTPPPYQEAHSKPWTSILTSRQIVPSIQFQVLLTLFSQFFSTFLRSTSPLSVSMSYLGLEEIYLPFYALFPKYATRKQKEIRETNNNRYRAFTFIGANFHWTSQLFDPHQPLAQKVHRSAPLLKHTLFLWPLPSSFATTDGISFDFFSWG